MTKSNNKHQARFFVCFCWFSCSCKLHLKIKRSSGSHKNHMLCTASQTLQYPEKRFPCAVQVFERFEDAVGCRRGLLIHILLPVSQQLARQFLHSQIPEHNSALGDAKKKMCNKIYLKMNKIFKCSYLNTNAYYWLSTWVVFFKRGNCHKQGQ